MCNSEYNEAPQRTLINTPIFRLRIKCPNETNHIIILHTGPLHAPLILRPALLLRVFLHRNVSIFLMRATNLNVSGNCTVPTILIKAHFHLRSAMLSHSKIKQIAADKTTGAAILRMLAAQTECPLPEKQAAHTTEHLLPAKQVPPMTELTYLADRAHALHIRGLILPIPAERPA